MILGIAMADILIGEVRHAARALIDSGYKVSFVPHKLQTKWTVLTRVTKIGITGLNGTICTHLTRTCAIGISSRVNPLIQIDVNVFLIKNLNSQLPHVLFDSIRNLPLHDLRLADYSISKASQVDLLLGGSVHPQVILDRIRKDP